MPTPSNAPDPESSRPYLVLLSTCPDLDGEQVPLQPEAQPPQSPSSWHPHPPPPYSGDAEALVGAIEPIEVDEGAGPSRSSTMSPWPRSASTHEPDPESDGMIISRDDPDESHKQADVDEMVAANGGPVSSSVVGSRATEDVVAHRASQRPAAQAQGSSGARRHHLPNIWSLAEEPETRDGERTMAGSQRWMEDSGLVGIGCHYSHTRVIPTSLSSNLRPGSLFNGTQQSERQRYDVQVEIKHVDLRESFLCGYLRIQGLTDDHPTLTTYFEGEIIGTKYSFRTQHPSWGATDKEDMSHWGKFAAFRPYQKQARKNAHVPIKDVHQKENIFMRWKEHFLVPDHRVRTINGASFEGFYYICFNQVRGEISGIYFHSKSEKFQQLELKHVEDKGCFGAMEFR